MDKTTIFGVDFPGNSNANTQVTFVSLKANQQNNYAKTGVDTNLYCLDMTTP